MKKDKKIVELARELELVSGNPIDTLSRAISEKIVEHKLPYQISCIMCCEQKGCETFKYLTKLIMLKNVFKKDALLSTANQCEEFSFIHDIVFTGKITEDYFLPKEEMQKLLDEIEKDKDLWRSFLDSKR